MKGLAVFVFVILSSPIHSQAEWGIEHLDQISKDAKALIELGDIDGAAQQYKRLVHIIKINKGLYHVSLVPFVVQLRYWEKAKNNFQAANDWGIYAAFIAKRNPMNPDLHRYVVTALSHNEIDTKCFNKEEWRYDSQSEFCKDQRYYTADTLILMIALQKALVANLPDSKDELVLLGQFSQLASNVMYGVDGNEFEIDEDTLRIVRGKVRPKYRYKQYLILYNKVKKQLEKFGGQTIKYNI